MTANPILVALDTPDLERAVGLARDLRPHVGGFKVGLTLMMTEGPHAVSRIADLGMPVFADAKLHDIPNTARGAARGLAGHGARWVTAHGAGGRSMLDAVRDGLGDDAGLLVVTVLTSLRGDDLKTTGLEGTVGAQVGRLAGLAEDSGAEGVVCAVDEVATVRAVSSRLVTVTPGIRIDRGRSHDQARVGTLGGALAAGSDLIVVGRAITAARDPVVVAIELAEEVGRRRPV